MDELKISVTAGPAHTVTVAGECDLHTCRQLRDVLTPEVAGLLKRDGMHRELDPGALALQSGVRRALDRSGSLTQGRG